jgi:Zn finger protein HypA/HybF involved in hydrogenase expression
MSDVLTAQLALLAALTIAAGAAMTRMLASRSEIRCSRCSYGGVVRRLPERCPMCGGDEWTTSASGAALAAPAAAVVTARDSRPPAQGREHRAG